MKFENIKTASRICDRIERLNKAKTQLEKWLNKHEGDSDGYTQGLYGFFLHEHKDGSGDSVDLTGCLLGYTIMEELGAKIDEQINDAR